MPIIKKITILLGIFFISGVAQVTAQEIKKIGKYKDWEAMIVLDADGKVCFAQSLPILQAPKTNKRDAKLFVAFRPNDKISNELVSLGFDVIPKNRRVSHILGVKIPKEKNKDYVSNLRKENIYISQRGSSLRIAPYLHNNDKDIERLINSLVK